MKTNTPSPIPASFHKEQAEARIQELIAALKFYKVRGFRCILVHEDGEKKFMEYTKPKEAAGSLANVDNPPTGGKFYMEVQVSENMEGYGHYDR